MEISTFFFLFLLLLLFPPSVYGTGEQTCTNDGECVAVDNHEHKEAAATRTTRSNVTVATLVTTGPYVRGALVLAESLERVGAIGDRIAFYIDSGEDDRSDITETDLKNLQKVGWELRKLSVEDGTLTKCRTSEETQQKLEEKEELKGMKRYWGTCAKFAIFTLEEYESVVYIDADSVVLNNFDFVYSYPTHDKILFAPGTPGCWKVADFVCQEFYGAFLVVKPLPHIYRYLHQVSEQADLAMGELPLLNLLFKNSWQKLPYGILVAATDDMRPARNLDGRSAQEPPSYEVDWSLINVYDFSGPPQAKPWNTFDLQQRHKDNSLHGYFGKVEHDSRLFHFYQKPQLMWNERYEAVLAKLGLSTEDDK